MDINWNDFLEVGANLATGGLYGVGKTIYEASNAASKAGDEISKIAAEADSALQQLFKSINAMTFEMSETARKIHEEFALARPDGRSESEMSAEEVHRLHALRAALDGLVTDLNTALAHLVDVEAHPQPTPEWMAALSEALAAVVALQNKIGYVNKLIGQILYEEPGDISKTAAHIEDIVEKFNTIEQQTIEDILNRVNTLEQPRIEGIMDGVTDNLAQTQGLVEDIRRLLWIPVVTPKTEFSDEEKAELAVQQKAAEVYGNLHALNLAEPAVDLAPAVRTGAQAAAVGSADGHEGAVRVAAEAGPSIAPTAASDNHPKADGSVMTLLKQQNLRVAQAAFCQREQRKAELAVKTIQSSKSLQPGVLTQTIDAIRVSIARFHEVEQPRLEQLLSSLDQTVQESQRTLHEVELTVAQVRATLANFQSLLANQWFKIGALVFAGLIGLILLFSVIALGRAAFGL